MDDYGTDTVDLIKSERQVTREYTEQWAYCEAKPIIDEFGMDYFITMITERYKNEQQGI